MKTSQMACGRVLGAIAMAVLLSGPVALAQSGSTNPKDVAKQTETLKKRAAALRDALTKTRAALDQSLLTYNTLVQGQSKNPSKDYSNLAKALDKLTQQREGARAKLAEMETKSNEIFALWEKEIASYSSEDLKKTGTDRLNMAKDRTTKVREGLKAAGEDYTKFITNFHDQVRFMGRDLSPEALSALAPEAQKLNDQATELFKKAEEIRAVLVQNEGAMGAKPTK